MMLMRTFLTTKSDFDFLPSKFFLIGLWRGRKRVRSPYCSQDGLIKSTVSGSFRQFNVKNLSIRLHAEAHSGSKLRLILRYDPLLLDSPLYLPSIPKKFQSPDDPSPPLTWGAANCQRTRANISTIKGVFSLSLDFRFDFLHSGKNLLVPLFFCCFCFDFLHSGKNLLVPLFFCC